MTESNSRDQGGLTRRPLLQLAVGGAALATVGAAARLAAPSDDSDGPGPTSGGFTLSTDEGDDVATLRLPLGDDLAPRVGARTWQTAQLPTSAHSMLALSWPLGEAPPSGFVRSRRRGRWGAWTRLPELHDTPDEATSRAGTDLMWIGRADGVQVRLEGARPDGLDLVLLYPRPRPGDALVDGLVDELVDGLVDGAPAARTAAGRSKAKPRAPRPRLVRRPKWGADESMRDGEPSYNRSIRQVHVHHTVNSNDYDRADVPALIRGMYAYHTRTLGWSDIGYNFLVDRFGRSFVGRAGGPGKTVRGAHTLGFNHQSTGVAAIGNYEAAKPTNAMLTAIAAIAAWKLDPFDRAPRRSIKSRSEGSDKYAAGQLVTLPIIDGHRHTNDTACPGKHLFAALPKVRRRAARIIAGTAR